MKNSNRVYLYKYYCEDEPYENEFIRVYEDKEKAIAQLKHDVEIEFDVPFNCLSKEIGCNESNGEIITPEHVRLLDGNGVASTWMVEEKEVDSNEASEIKQSESVPLVVHYSFDSDTPVWLFATEDEAKAELKRQFDEEVRIETKEDGHILGEDLETDFAENGTWASVTTYIGESKDVMEWSVGDIRTTKD